MQISDEKRLLRKKASALRSAIENREELSERISKKLFSLDAYLSCNQIFAYFSYGCEVQTKLIIEKALSDGKKTALPRCEKGGTMSFHYIKSKSDLEEGVFKGIFEPKASCKKAVPDEGTLVLVPALAFGRDGTRLGHGMGFYDRFLSGFPGKTVGLCFEKSLFETLPQDENDIPVLLIITENEILSGKNAAQT